MENKIETLADVKDESSLIPASKNVKLLVKKVEVRETDKAGLLYDWRNLNVQFQLVDGIGEEGKFKNSNVFGSITYYVNPEGIAKKSGLAYGTQDYYKTRLSNLKMFVKAIGDDLGAVRLDEASMTEYVQALSVGAVGKSVVANINVQAGKDGYPDSNEVKYYKAVSIEDSI